MIKTDKQLKVPKWSKNEINRWADYIELRCLYMDDHLVSKDDVLDIFIDEDLDELQRGEAEHSLKYDKLSSVIGNYYEIIYVFLTIFLYLLKCPQSLILSALRAFCFCGKPHISRSIFLYFRYQAWLKSW
ncbi:MAG: hypothetical protein ACLTHR_06110 [Agathobacter rectalis]